jgi:hypothetical protein
MGRIVDLCGEIAAAADEGPEGLVLPPESWDRLRDEWADEDIEDAMSFVRDSLLQSELMEAADNLCSRLVEILGEFGEAGAFKSAEAGEARMSIDLIDQLARRVARLEEVLEIYRDGPPPDRRGFDALRGRLADQGIEKEMRGEGGGDDPDDED